MAESTGSEPLSDSILTPPADTALAERLASEQFRRRHAAPEYRHRLDRLFEEWHLVNGDHFGGVLAVPHIGIGRVAPRRFSQCRLTTDYGGQTDITLSEGVVFGTNASVVRRPYPAEGARRFEADLLLARR